MPKKFDLPVDPLIVGVDDRTHRRAAAWVVAKAHATAPQAWTLALLAPTIGVGAGLLIDGDNPVSAWDDAAAFAPTMIVFFALVLMAYSASSSVTVYLAPRRTGYRLCFVRTPAAAAAVILRPDRRRTALPTDVQGAAAGAWPKHKGAGTALETWVRDLVHDEGGRITLTTTPWLVGAYRRHGFVLEKRRTAGLLPRLASRPAEGERAGRAD